MSPRRGMHVLPQHAALAAVTNQRENHPMLLILGIILLIIAIAGGAIVHPIIFALAIIALILFFTGWRGRPLEAPPGWGRGYRVRADARSPPPHRPGRRLQRRPARE